MSEWQPKTDIVERLRDRNAVVMSGLFHAIPTMNEAANKIERLQTGLRRIVSLEAKNVPKYAQRIALEALREAGAMK